MRRLKASIAFTSSQEIERIKKRETAYWLHAPHESGKCSNSQPVLPPCSRATFLPEARRKKVGECLSARLEPKANFPARGLGFFASTEPNCGARGLVPFVNNLEGSATFAE